MANGIGLNTSQYTRTYTSFSGCDIEAVFHNTKLAELNGISYSITREKAPIYTMGSADPRSFSRGKRGIAGSLIFTVFDRHSMHSLIDQSLYAAKMSDFRNPVTVHEAGGLATGSDLGYQLRKAVYADQIPPFDITLSATNEYGQAASMRIWAIEILNEGTGMSVDDIVMESQMTFVARHITPWVPKSVNEVPGFDITGETIQNPESVTQSTSTLY
jgi:hypothetical protein